MSGDISLCRTFSALAKQHCLVLCYNCLLRSTLTNQKETDRLFWLLKIFLGSVQPPHSARISQSKWMLSVANLVIYCNDFGKFLHDPVQTRETI